MIKKKPRKIKDMWNRLSVVKQCGAVAGALLVIGALTKGTWALVQPLTGTPPFASQEFVLILAGLEEQRLNSGQIARQVEIERLKQRCAVRCDNYDRKALENLIEQWQREQQYLDRIRKAR